jgi:hypothetical protein
MFQKLIFRAKSIFPPLKMQFIGKGATGVCFLGVETQHLLNTPHNVAFSEKCGFYQ